MLLTQMPCRVEIDGLTVGHIKKGSCSRIKNLMASSDYFCVEIKSMGVGRYKELYEDEDGNLRVERGRYPNCWVHLTVTALPKAKSIEQKTSTTDVPATEPASQSAPAPSSEPVTRDPSKFVSFASLEKASTATTERSAPSEQRPAAKKGKGTFILMRVLCVILGLLGLGLSSTNRVFWLLIVVAIWGWGKAKMYLDDE